MLMNYSPYDEFPHRIKFQHVKTTDDGMGGQIEDGWEDVDKDKGNDGWSEALVTDISGTEYQQASVNVNPIIKNIYFPYRTDILPNMRVMLDSGQIVAIKTRPLDQGGQHEIMLIEVTGGELND